MLLNSTLCDTCCDIMLANLYMQSINQVIGGVNDQPLVAADTFDHHASAHVSAEVDAADFHLVLIVNDDNVRTFDTHLHRVRRHRPCGSSSQPNSKHA